MVQNQFLNKVLKTKDSSLITLNNLTTEFFSDYKDEFNFIKNHFQQYGQIPDVTTFLNIFPNFDVVEVNESDKYLLDALYEDRNKRFLVTTFNKIRDAVNNNDTDKALQIYKQSSEKLVQVKYLEAIDIFQDTSRYDTFVERSNNFNKFYTSTGFPELDSIIGGWDRKEENAVIIARPGIGKSWVLMKAALEAAKQGLRVGFYEGEITVDKTGRRLDTLYGHLPNGSLNHGDLNLINDYKKYFENIPQEMKDKFYIITPIELGRFATVGDLRAFIEKYKLDMLCVDQYSLLEDERKGRNKIEKTANIAHDIKNLQVMSRIPIISVSQQNREKPEEGGATTANISNADDVGQYATIVIAIEKKDDILTLNITKSRDGGDNRHLRYMVDLNKGNFIFLPDEDDSTKGAKCDDLKNEYEYENKEENEDPF